MGSRSDGGMQVGSRQRFTPWAGTLQTHPDPLQPLLRHFEAGASGTVCDGEVTPGRSACAQPPVRCPEVRPLHHPPYPWKSCSLNLNIPACPSAPGRLCTPGMHREAACAGFGIPFGGRGFGTGWGSGDTSQSEPRGCCETCGSGCPRRSLAEQSACNHPNERLSLRAAARAAP